MTETAEPERSLAGGRRAARRAAVQALYQWLVAGTETGDLMRQFQVDGRLIRCDRDYFDALVRGAIQDTGGLEAIFAAHLDRAPELLDPVERAILLLAVFELRERIDVPCRVVLNEALELAKRFGAEGGHRYVNGVLDGVARELRATETRAST